MEDIVRVGFISSMDKEKGMAQVYYPDRGSTTELLHLFAMRGEYCPFDVGNQVVVLHLSNDTSSGIILGRFWGDENIPPKVDYQNTLKQDIWTVLADKTYVIHCPEIRLEGTAGSMTLSELVNLRKRVEELERKVK